MLQGQVRPRPARGSSQAHGGVSPLSVLTHRTQQFQPLPVPLGEPPYHFDLETVAPGITAEAAKLGKLVFHCVGDTGGVKSPEFQAAVAAAMKGDLLLDDSARPRFFYHLGDVIYYNGQIADYYGQFYEPYDHYGPPILAIPGNHDGDPADATQTSLDGWVRYFMSPKPVVRPESADAPRVTLSLPNPYFTVTAPFVTIIGMYTNVPEGGSIDSVQQQWLTHEFATAPMDKALIVAMHHPIYSFDDHHSGSAAMADALQHAINDSRRVPNMVLAAHVHNYQVIEKVLVPQAAGATAHAAHVPFAGHPKKGKTPTKPAPPAPAPGGTANTPGATPFIVAGMGGYYHLHGMNAAAGVIDQATGAHLLFEEHQHHGYMTLTVDGSTISGHMQTVPSGTGVGATPGPTHSFSYPAGAITLPENAVVSL